MGYTYVVSDVHGQYELFKKLLKELSFNINDKLYILGDILDKGNNSLELVDFIRNNKNMICILGNHEYEFLKYYDRIMKDYNGDSIDALEKLQNYFDDDYKLTWDIVDYIDSLPGYVETDKFIGVHAGFEVYKDKTILPLKKQRVNYMVYDRKFKDIDIINSFGKPILFGHTPCNYINNDGKFIKYPNIFSKNILDYVKIRLDNGAIYTNMLGALRIEDMKEIYVYGGNHLND